MKIPIISTNQDFLSNILILSMFWIPELSPASQPMMFPEQFPVLTR